MALPIEIGIGASLFTRLVVQTSLYQALCNISKGFYEPLTWQNLRCKLGWFYTSGLLTFTDGNSDNVKELYLRTPVSIESVVPACNVQLTRSD